MLAVYFAIHQWNTISWVMPTVMSREFVKSRIARQICLEGNGIITCIHYPIYG